MAEAPARRPLLELCKVASCPQSFTAILEVRDGDQHDIDATIARFSIAQRLDVAKTVKALRKVVNKRLPKELGRIPIELGATQDDVVLRVSAGDVLLDLITSFCENFGLDNDMGNRVLAVARQRFS